MPRIHESPPPVCVGVAELNLYDKDLSEFQGSFNFTVAGEEVKTDPDEPRLEKLVKGTESVWRTADEDYRALQGLQDGEGVLHHMTLLNNGLFAPSEMSSREEMMGFWEMFGFSKSMGSLAHIDGAGQDGPSGRYITHTTEPTEFYIGNRWFLPFDIHRTSKVGSVVAFLGNIPAIALQARHASKFTPDPNIIVRIDEQVHRSPRRAYRQRLGKLVVDTVYIAPVEEL